MRGRRFWIFGLWLAAVSAPAWAQMNTTCRIAAVNCRSDGRADVTVECSGDNTWAPGAVACCDGPCTQDWNFECDVRVDHTLTLRVDGSQFGSVGFWCSSKKDFFPSCYCGVQSSNRCRIWPPYRATATVSGNETHFFAAEIRSTVPHWGGSVEQTDVIWSTNFNPGCRGGGDDDGGGGGCTRDDQCGGGYCCNGACQAEPCQPQPPPPPPGDWDAVIEVRGPRPWYPPLPLDPNKRRRTPLSFRLWDPSAGYVFEGDRRPGPETPGCGPGPATGAA